MIVLALPTVNWGELMSLVQSELGTSPTRCLDKFKIKLDSPIALLLVLATLRDDNFDPNKNEYPKDLLDHIDISFLVKSEQIQDLLILPKLKISCIPIDRKNDFMIITGSLLTWVDAIILGCSIYVSKNVREISNQIYLIFDRTELRCLWNKYSKIKYKETFILKEK